MHTRSYRLTLDAVLTAMALALSLAERLLPLSLFIPIPGFRIGLSNVVTVFALCRLSSRDALGILIARCLLAAICGGTVSGLLFSLSGGLLALIVMALLSRCAGLSLIGVCIGGAAAHSTGQILAAMLRFRSMVPLLYLPPLLLLALVTGAVTGLLSLLLVHRIPAKFTDFSTQFK